MGTVTSRIMSNDMIDSMNRVNVDGKLLSPQNTVILFGDSITGANGTDSLFSGNGTNLSYTSDGWFNWANVMLGHRFKLLSNKGIGGNTTTQMLARIQTDIINFTPKPGYVIVQGGGNDVNADTSFTTITSNLKTIYTKLNSVGIKVIATTILPTVYANTTARKRVLNSVNRWIKEYAFNNPNLIVVDFNSAIVDISTGDPITGLTADGTHPNATGAFKIATVLYNTLKDKITNLPLLLNTNGDPDNLLTNGMLTGNTNGLATGWVISGGGVSTPTKIVRTDGTDWQQVSCTSGINRLFVQNTNVGVDWKAGDSVYAQCEFELDNNLVGNTDFHLQLDCWNGLGSTQDLPSITYHHNFYMTSGVFRTPPIVIPAGTARLQFFVGFMSGSGTYRIGRCEVRKVSSYS